MMARYTGMEIPPPIDPEELKQREESKVAMRAWTEDITRQFQSEIKAEDASVRLSTSEDILELTTKHDYIRIVYDPKDNQEKPYQQYAFHSKDEFNDEATNPVDMPRYVNLSREAVGKLVSDIKDWLKALNDKSEEPA